MGRGGGGGAEVRGKQSYQASDWGIVTGRTWEPWPWACVLFGASLLRGSRDARRRRIRRLFGRRVPGRVGSERPSPPPPLLSLCWRFALGVVLFAMAVQAWPRPMRPAARHMRRMQAMLEDYPWTSTKKNSCQLFEYISTCGSQASRNFRP